MATTLKVIAVGNSAGVLLSKELLEKLRVEKGDVLHAVETPNGIELSAFDSEVAAEMDVAEKVMKRRRNLLKKLAE